MLSESIRGHGDLVKIYTLECFPSNCDSKNSCTAIPPSTEKTLLSRFDDNLTKVGTDIAGGHPPPPPKLQVASSCTLLAEKAAANSDHGEGERQTFLLEWKKNPTKVGADNAGGHPPLSWPKSQR